MADQGTSSAPTRKAAPLCLELSGPLRRTDAGEIFVAACVIDPKVVAPANPRGRKLDLYLDPRRAAEYGEALGRVAAQAEARIEKSYSSKAYADHGETFAARLTAHGRSHVEKTPRGREEFLILERMEGLEVAQVVAAGHSDLLARNRDIRDRSTARYLARRRYAEMMAEKERAAGKARGGPSGRGGRAGAGRGEAR